LIITESRRFSLERAVSPIAGFMEFNLLFVQLFQYCCHLSKQSLEICGSMFFVLLLELILELIAALATVSAVIT